MNQKLSSTLEDYLEAIYRVEREKRAARVRDISAHLGVAKSTVNAALKSLVAKDLIHYQPYQLIMLTEEGRRIAEEIVINHEVMRHFLRDVLGLEAERAEYIACEMEHAVDRDVIERFACFLAFVENLDGRQRSWIDQFRRTIRDGPRADGCQRVLREYMEALQSKIAFGWEHPERQA